MTRSSIRVALGWRVYRYLPVLASGHLLDIGCGNGEWLAWIRDNVKGWDVTGLETNIHAAECARKTFGLEVYVGELADQILTPGYYDMVTFWHSLEHMPSPSEALQKAFHLLRRGGWVGIEVPNIESWQARFMGNKWTHLAVPVHLYHFSPSTLSSVLKKCGFQVREIRSVRNAGLPQATGSHGRLSSFLCRAAGALGGWALRVYAVKP